MEWFKLNGFNYMYGSLRIDTPIQRLVFVELLALASISRVRRTVCLSEGVPYPRAALAGIIGISEQELNSAIEHHLKPEQSRLRINEWGGMEVVKWDYYQSKSYDRVRKFRDKKRDCNAGVTQEGVSCNGREENRIEENRIEENRTEGSSCSDSVTSCNNDITKFDTFWRIYPRKVGKGDARKSFEKINPDDNMLRSMIAAVEKNKTTVQWQKDNGQFIPHPATWLNQGRWEDEPDIQKTEVIFTCACGCGFQGTRKEMLSNTSGKWYHTKDCRIKVLGW